jgi:hypothetical protein
MHPYFDTFEVLKKSWEPYEAFGTSNKSLRFFLSWVFILSKFVLPILKTLFYMSWAKKGENSKKITWRLIQEQWNFPGVVETKPGAMEAQPGAMETHPGDMEAHSGDIEARPGAIEAHSGAMEAHSGAMEVHSGAMEVYPGHVEALPRSEEAHYWPL